MRSLILALCIVGAYAHIYNGPRYIDLGISHILRPRYYGRGGYYSSAFSSASGPVSVGIGGGGSAFGGSYSYAGPYGPGPDDGPYGPGPSGPYGPGPDDGPYGPGPSGPYGPGPSGPYGSAGYYESSLSYGRPGYSYGPVSPGYGYGPGSPGYGYSSSVYYSGSGSPGYGYYGYESGPYGYGSGGGYGYGSGGGYGYGSGGGYGYGYSSPGYSYYYRSPVYRYSYSSTGPYATRQSGGD